MILTYAQGGLGNLIFQVVFTLVQANKYKSDYCFVNWHENLKIIEKKHLGDVQSYSKTIFKNIDFQKKILNPKPFIEHYCPFHFLDLPYESSCINFYKGYFQSELYHKNFDWLLKNLFQPDTQIKTLIENKYPFLMKNDCVAMHVRRGDYIQIPDFHPVLDLGYYEKALELCNNFDKILVFTNDKFWCYENISHSRIIYIDEPDWLSLYIMSFCNNHIIANSSFSWWGARFAEIFNENKKINVLFPNVWFGPSINENIKDLIPGRWSCVNLSTA